MEVVAFHPKPRLRLRPSTLAIGVGLALALLAALVGIATLAGRVPRLPQGRALDLFALSFLLGAGPPALVLALRQRAKAQMDQRLPDFLTDVASLHKAGLTLHEAIITASEGEYGPLSPHARKAADQLRWNLPALQVLENLQRDVGTPLATRTLTVVIEAGRTGGNVPEVLEIAARNARAGAQMRQTRKRAMGIYTIITYVASVVFIGVALAMQAVFVPKMIAALGAVQGGRLGLASSVPSAASFRAMFYVAALVQAAGNGIVGGIMSEGSASAGLKHSWVLVALTTMGFALL